MVDARIPRLTRRHVIAGATAMACAACEGDTKAEIDLSAVGDIPLSVSFASPAGRAVQLDFRDQRNFRLLDVAGATETLVLDAGICLHLPARDGQEEQVWRFGDLGPERSGSKRSSTFELRPTLIPAKGLASWGVQQSAYDVTLPAGGALEAALDVTVARLQSLARAQWIIATRLLPAMQMSFCGDAVKETTRCWNADLIAQGWAVLATSDGIRLDGPVGQTTWTPELPPGIKTRAFLGGLLP